LNQGNALRKRKRKKQIPPPKDIYKIMGNEETKDERIERVADKLGIEKVKASTLLDVDYYVNAASRNKQIEIPAANLIQ
jgi:hypothetical protein